MSDVLHTPLGLSPTPITLVGSCINQQEIASDWTQTTFVSLAPTKSYCSLLHLSLIICHILTGHNTSNVHSHGHSP